MTAELGGAPVTHRDQVDPRSLFTCQRLQRIQPSSANRLVLQKLLFRRIICRGCEASGPSPRRSQSQQVCHCCKFVNSKAEATSHLIPKEWFQESMTGVRVPYTVDIYVRLRSI